MDLIKNYAPRIAVLLTCFNRKEKTIKCLESLFDATMPEEFELEVFLVDDGSMDGTGEEVQKVFPKVNVISGDGNLFWNRGMNLAWKTATDKGAFSFYLWLNDDVIVHKYFLKSLLKDFEKIGKSDSIVVGPCSSLEGEVTYSGYINLRNNRKIEPNGEIQLCEYFNGNVVLIPHAVFKKVGYLDPIYHHDQGDFDYGLRAEKLGVKSYVCAISIGICERHSELPRWCNPNYPLGDRLKSFKSPLGGRPKLTFIFQKKYIGLTIAIYHYLTIHVRLVFPRLWIRKN